MKKAKEIWSQFIGKTHIPVWLAVLLTAVLVLRIPSFFEPYSYGDETIYLTLGEAVRRGLTLYKHIHDNKPPLLYLLTAISGNLFWFKAILAFWSLITVVFFWHLVRALFPGKDKLHKVAVISFGILTTIPLFEGNIANAENFMIGPTIVAFLILFSKKLNFQNIFLAGILFSFATLFKVPAAFDVPVIVVFWLITSGLKAKSLKETLKNSFFLFLGFALPLGLSLLWYFTKGALGEYLGAAFLQNIGYLSTWRPDVAREGFLVRNLPLIIRGGILIAACSVLYKLRSKLSKPFIFTGLWLVFGLFAATLSERPYPHYLLQIVPAISIFLAMLIAQRSLEQSLAIIPLALTFFVPHYYHFWYYPTTPYYQRFINFAVGTYDRTQYFSTFNKEVPVHYEIADFLAKSSNPDDKVFVWGPDSSNIYALSRRLPPGKYVADYHISDFFSTEVQSSLLEKDKPAFIILLPNAKPFPQLVPLLRENYIQILNVHGAEVWRLIERF